MTFYKGETFKNADVKQIVQQQRNRTKNGEENSSVLWESCHERSKQLFTNLNEFLSLELGNYLRSIRNPKTDREEYEQDTLTSFRCSIELKVVPFCNVSFFTWKMLKQYMN